MTIPSKEARLIEQSEAWRHRAMVAEANARLLNATNEDLRELIKSYTSTRVLWPRTVRL